MSDYKLDIAIAKMKRGDEIANFGNEFYDQISTDWNPQAELLDTRPPEFELVCVGEYDGVDTPNILVKPEHNNTLNMTPYLAWQALPNPEYDCEVIIS